MTRLGTKTENDLKKKQSIGFSFDACSFASRKQKKSILRLTCLQWKFSHFVGRGVSKKEFN